MRRLLAAFAAIRDLPRSTPIGAGLATTRPRALVALLAAGLVTSDVMRGVFVGWDARSPLWFELERWAFVVAAVAMLWLLAGRRGGPLGLTLRPRQGVRVWVRYTAIMAGLIAIASIPVGLALWLGGALDASAGRVELSPDHLADLFRHMVVRAPIYEELLFRVVICTALVAVAGTWPGLLGSALIFGVAHVHNPDPTNLIAGVAFGWAYLVSGSVVVSMTWHALGNLVVFLAQVGYAAGSS